MAAQSWGAEESNASSKPSAPGNKDAVCASGPSDVTGPLTERMTLTLSGLLKSRQLHLLITGEEKLATYQQALKNNNAKLSPISAVLQQESVPVKVYWAP